jgi:hypothetical protein
LIFRRYLEVSGTNELVRDLRAKNICTKVRTTSAGKTHGGNSFGRGALTSASKAGVRYRYYVSHPSLRGEARTAQLGSISRVPAAEIEQAIVVAVQQHTTGPDSDRKNRQTFDQKNLSSLVSHIEVQSSHLVIALRPVGQLTEAATLSIPWQKPPSK